MPSAVEQFKSNHPPIVKVWDSTLCHSETMQVDGARQTSAPPVTTTSASATPASTPRTLSSSGPLPVHGLRVDSESTLACRARAGHTLVRSHIEEDGVPTVMGFTDDSGRLTVCLCDGLLCGLIRRRNPHNAASFLALQQVCYSSAVFFCCRLLWLLRLAR